MFRSTGLFKELVCPIQNCDRPNCVFWHEESHLQNRQNAPPPNPPTSITSPSAQNFYGYNAYVAADEYNIPSQYAPLEPPSMGYTGYVAPSYSGTMSFPPENGYHATMNSPSTSRSPTGVVSSISNYSPLSPEPIIPPVPKTISPPPPLEKEIVIKTEVEDDDIVIVAEKIKSPVENKTSVIARLSSLPIPKALPDVASLDAEIERLQKLREKAKRNSNSFDQSASPPQSPAPVLTPAPKPKPISVVGYTPTPLEDLRKQKEEERKKKLEKEERRRLRELEAQKEQERKEKERLKRAVAEKKSRKLEIELFEDDDVPAKISKLDSPEKRRAFDEASFNQKVEERMKKMAREKAHMSPKPLPSPKPPPPQRPVMRPPPVVPRSSEAALQMRKQEKGVGLSAEQIAAAKQRIARPGADTIVRPVKTSRHLPTPSETLRLRQERKAAEIANTRESCNGKPKTLEQIYGSKTKTSVSARSDGRRVATASSSSTPKKTLTLLDPTNSKVPNRDRMSYLQRFYDELINFMTPEESLEQAAQEEKILIDKVHARKGYLIAAVNTLNRLRSASENKKNPNSKKTPSVSHFRCLAGKSADLITVGAHGPKRESLVTESSLYKALSENYLLTSAQIVQNSYPHFTCNNTVYIEPSYYDKKKCKKTFTSNSDLERFCVRCCKEYRLCPKGIPQKATCVYHLRGKARMPGKRRNNESTYPCCGSDDGEAGCLMAEYHVSDTLRQIDLDTFIATPKPTGENDPRSTKVYALDCEMVYTVWGPFLARITIVDMKDDVVLDEFIKPDHTVIDYNTTFSGITTPDLINAKYSLKTIRERIFELINSETIIVGHSLESDLKAMRLVHNSIVDTAILFPHRTENDKKRGLKELAMDKLNKVIQEDLGGHDSKEDAVTAFQLVLHKAKFEGKL